MQGLFGIRRVSRPDQVLDQPHDHQWMELPPVPRPPPTPGQPAGLEQARESFSDPGVGKEGGIGFEQLEECLGMPALDPCPTLREHGVGFTFRGLD